MEGNPNSMKCIGESLREIMVDEGRDSSSHQGDRGHGGDSWSAIVGSGGSSIGGSSRKRKFSAPRCSCGSYAILFECSTTTNPNRLFFGCQHFKTKGGHCRYFAWLDEYVALAHQGAGGIAEEVVDPMKRIEERMASLEEMMMLISDCKKGKIEVSSIKLGGYAVSIRDCICLFLGCSS
ncbi:hypothetical protein PIB30_069491 [Stylosanthes scabra]|uniref:GRF-type domain-containing protein n=1 Tax=Stylosanthes scabra TaxID=79078 RepID=A0ABU6RNG1_9FABA|nr:hypothetical protein [Stylosanthes scabra]